VDFKSDKWDELERLRDEVQELSESENVDHYHARLVTKLKRILELDPTDKVALFWLGDFYHKLEIYEKALDYFEKIIELDENHTYAWFHKGMILCETEKYEDAIKCYDKVMLMDEPPDQTWFNKGLALHKLGKHKQALECYEQYMKYDEKHHNDLDVLTLKSAALLELGRNDEARVCYDCAIKLDSSLKTRMERPKPKMRLWKRVLHHAGIWVGVWGMFHVILVITRSVV
tara:strand:+ start:138 stop:827 length:690 start_codon:yes stop_codon:yes gene_type:complete